VNQHHVTQLPCCIDSDTFIARWDRFYLVNIINTAEIKATELIIATGTLHTYTGHRVESVVRI